MLIVVGDEIMIKSILRNLKQQDPDIERQIFEKYYERVYYAAYFVMKDPDLAQDVLQESFVKAFKNIHTVQDEEKLGAWLATIATRTAIDHLRKRKKWNDFTTTDVLMDIEATDANANDDSTVESSLENKMIREVLANEIEKLSPNYKEIMILHYVQQYSYEEIGQILEMNIGTVKTRVFRAKKMLKESIEKHPELMEAVWNV